MNGDDTVPALLESRAAGTSLQIARLALTASAYDWDPHKAIAALPTGSGHAVRDARDRYAQALRPLEATEPDLKGSLARTVRDAFAPIGAKMRPDMSLEQAGVWTAAMVVAFSDLPNWIVVEAMKEAVHKTFEFPSDMEAEVRRIAEAKFLKHRIALARLEQCLEAMRGALNPAPRLEDRTEEPMVLDEARKLVFDSPADVRRTVLEMGRGCGAIRPEDFEILKSELEKPLEPQCEGPDGCGKP
jgi:hypothetical protein